MHYRIPLYLALSLSVQCLKYLLSLLRVKFRENVGKIWNHLLDRPTTYD